MFSDVRQLRLPPQAPGGRNEEVPPPFRHEAPGASSGGLPPLQASSRTRFSHGEKMTSQEAI